MKLLYGIFVVCIAVNAEPEPPTREQLENLVQLLLQNVEGGLEAIEKDLADIDKIVQKKLLDNLLVKQVKSDLNEKLSKNIDQNEKNQDLLDCSVSIEEGFGKLKTEIYYDFLQNLTNGRHAQRGDYISTLKKDLFEVEDALQNRADKEIKLCLDGKSRCRLTNEFLTTSEEYFAFQSIVKHSHHLLNEYLKSKNIVSKIVVDFIHPANDCLNEA